MSRIPVSLQAVFLASNRGQEVNKPPPGNMASRVFSSVFKNHPRSWFRRKKAPKNNKETSLAKIRVALSRQQRHAAGTAPSAASPISEIVCRVERSNNKKSTSRDPSNSEYDEDSTTSPGTFMQSPTSGSDESPRESLEEVVSRISNWYTVFFVENGDDDKPNGLLTYCFVVSLHLNRTLTPCCNLVATQSKDIKSSSPDTTTKQRLYNK
jgi:hypothetical protein